jgi:hypothetical protein
MDGCRFGDEPCMLFWFPVHLLIFNHLFLNQNLDFLVRREQHHSIVRRIVASGRWIPVDTQEHFSPETKRIAAVPQLKHVEEDFYINLWSEDIVGLQVDDELFEVPHVQVCAFDHTILAESHFCPQVDSTTDSDGPTWTSHEGMHLVQVNPDQSPPVPPQRTAVYIPTIPRYLDALLSWADCSRDDPHPRFMGPGKANEGISYLIRHLSLETENQRAKLLPMLSERGREIMYQRLDGYRRTEEMKFHNRDFGELTARLGAISIGE